VSTPRPIFPDQTYFVSRRCTQRQFLLRPTDETRKFYEYCLAEAASRFDVAVIAWLAMSNHHHLVVHDRHGNLPAFLAHLHKMLAKVLNQHWGRWENLFAAEPPCITRCVDVEDALDKVVYVLANPVVDHLVDRCLDWPGASSLPFLDGRTKAVARPRKFFRENGVMPELVSLRAEPPPGWRGSSEQWAETVRQRVALAETAARDERRAAGRTVMGRRTVLRVSAFDSPDTHEPRRNLRPLVACKNRQRRIDALMALKRFRVAYRRAWEAFVGGARNTVFPAGTYIMRLLGADCAPFQAVPTS
jgi:putative transposase